MWSIVIKYILDFLKWLWENKFTILFMFTTFIVFCMYGCEKKENEKLSDKLTKAQSNIEVCENQKEIALNCNADLESGLDLCQKELQITKDSYKEAEVIVAKFDEEIEKYKQLAAEIDNEKDAEKALEMKKELIEELFRGKSNSQITQIKNNIHHSIQIKFKTLQLNK